MFLFAVADWKFTQSHALQVSKKAGGNAANMADLDWDKVKLENDTFNPEAAYRYEGTLQFTLKNNVLGISGTMNRK